MSRRYARKVDTTQAEIVAALRKAGWLVWIIEEPCDLLCFKAGVWRTLECKSPRNKRGDPKRDKRQAKQDEFIELTGTALVTSAEGALAALEWSPNEIAAARASYADQWTPGEVAAHPTGNPFNFNRLLTLAQMRERDPK